jgi:hypothetical protein
MSFNGKEGQVYPLEEASRLTSRYRERSPNGGKGVFYGREALLALLDQPGSMGIRFYFGLKESDPEDDCLETVVCVSADEDENDQLENGLIYQGGQGCPKRCGTLNRLNT